MLSSITMCFNSRYLSLLLILAPASAAVVSDGRFKLSAGDLSSAEALVEDYHRAHRANSEHPAAVASHVRFKLSAGDLSSAEALVEDYPRANGANAEYAAAVSWLARW